MPYNKSALVFACIFFLFSSQASAADTIFVKSPDGKIVFKLFQREQQLYFTASLSNQLVVAPSPMKFFVDGISLTSKVSISKLERYRGNETYPVFGAHATARNSFNGITVYTASARRAIKASLDIRVFNDGVGFRHSVNSGAATVTPIESTVFNLPFKSTIWYHDLTMHYEGVHVKKQIDSVNIGEWIAPPATVKLPSGFYASITEAALLGYPGMALRSNGKSGLVITLASDQPTSYPYKLRYSAEDTLRMRQPAKLTGAFKTPWRVVIIGRDLNALVNNDIITNLNSPPDPKLFPNGMNTKWIRPGRAVWKYLDGGGDGTPEVMKHFTDGAAALGFEHSILEGFWAKWPEEQLKDLVDYSRQKGVGIWLWKHSKTLRSQSSRDSFFNKCSALGITGAKIDFFDSEAKEVIDLYDSILHDAAEHHVLLDFHGANKPTGLMRSYPNALVYEAVKGMEASKLNDRATHETTIPFTRLLAGPAEYTVLHFGERRKNTTWAHQVASIAILTAPLLTYAANPDTILLNPAVNIIKAIPPVWDETIVLPPTEIGELAVFARRKGEVWFLAVANGVQPKKIRVPLNFLKGSYQAEIAKDGLANNDRIVIERTKYSSKDVLELNLVTGGGFIAKFSK